MAEAITATQEFQKLIGPEPLTLSAYQKLLREMAGGGKETESSPWLPELARFSLSVLDHQKPGFKTEGVASAGCYFNKKVVEEVIEMCESGKGMKEILERLEIVFRDYAFVVAAPLVASRNPNRSAQNRLLGTFININLRKKPSFKQSQDFAFIYSQFNQSVREESLAVQQGIFGELFAYLFLKQAGHSPIPSKISEDIKGTDFYLAREGGERTPIQIKTSLHEKLFWVSIREGSPRLFIFLNPEGILKNHLVVKALFGEDTPDKSCIISFTEEVNQALTKL